MKYNIAVSKGRELLLLTLVEIFSYSAVFVARSNTVVHGAGSNCCNILAERTFFFFFRKEKTFLFYLSLCVLADGKKETLRRKKRKKKKQLHEGVTTAYDAQSNIVFLWKQIHRGVERSLRDK